MPPKRQVASSKGKISKAKEDEISLSTIKNNGGLSNLITEKDIINAQSKQQLIGFINELTTSKSDQVFDEYKKKVSEQLSNNAILIEQLNTELGRKQTMIDNLIEENLSLKRSFNGGLPSADSNQSFESPIRRKQQSNIINHNQLEKELEDIGTFLDLIELLTGIVLIDCFEQDSKYHFDIQQTSSNKTIEMNYRLIVDTSFKENIDIDYIPTFMESKNKNLVKLQSILPEYLCENLSFSLSTLGQFYSKVNKAINKKDIGTKK